MQGFFLLSGLKTFNCGSNSNGIGRFVSLFMYILIRYFIVCTILPFVVPQVKFYFCFFAHSMSLFKGKKC